MIATIPRSWLKMPCAKNTYSTLDYAKRTARWRRKRDRSGKRARIAAYWCDACGGWHIGHRHKE